ncbi:uncharacterized protein [Mycetomoellerius zeteki]|nr:PREDICTED: uncharacterized protein LOC108727182 [Trachymyrmex zeteki]
MYSVVGLTLCKLLISISLKRRKMKRSVTFFVLALIATVIAGDESLEEIAKKLKTNVTILQACLNEEGIKKEDISTWLQRWTDLENAKEDATNAYQTQMKYNSFIACLLEKQGLLVDSKLVVDKLIENIKEESSKSNLPPPSEEYLTTLTECLNSLNENSQLTREDRAFGLITCAITSAVQLNKEKQ